MTKKRCRIVLADDHSLFRQGLKRILSERPDLEVVGDAADGTQAIARLESEIYDVMVTDYKMPECSGLEVLKRCIRASCSP